MKIINLFCPVLYLTALALAGCGSSGGVTSTAATPTTTPSTVISGLASKGPINAGTVKVFAIRNGSVDTTMPIGQGQTDAAGNYTIDCGSYKGSVMVEVAGGTFTDEVSGTTVTLKSPLQAVFANASTGKKTVAITPLTHLASKRAQSHPQVTSAIINESNVSVASTFNLTADIVTTLPIAGSSSDDQKKYAAACGSFSQLANNRQKSKGGSLDDALKGVMDDMSNETEHNGGLSDNSINDIKSAEAEFNSGGKNQTGATAPIAAPKDGILKISTSGGTNIGAVDITLDLPAGANVPADPVTGEAAATAVTISGAAATGSNKLISAKVTPAANGNPGKVTISMINAAGFGPGECVTIDFTMTAGATFPASASSFTVSGVTAKDTSGKLISGVTAGPASLAAL